ncbi:FtsX-like permease family protein [bacterium]|nr:FtsX-like permease family protein [bacterium]
MKNIKLTLKLALRNLFGTGIRLWINVAVITVSIIVIIFSRALYAGLESQMFDSLIKTEVASGQIRAEGFDPFDSLTYDNTVSSVPLEVKELIKEDKAVPILYCNGTLYTGGRVMQIGFRGIKTDQSILDLPSKSIGQKGDNENYTIMIGLRMLKLLRLKKDDSVTIKWRDKNGAFDAADFKIKQLIDKNNPRVDTNVIWLDINVLRKLFGFQSEASTVVFKQKSDFEKLKLKAETKWTRHSRKELVSWVVALIDSDKAWAHVIYGLLIFLCCIGIFNSQILEVFKRRREIGTLMALGMRKKQIVALFTTEGILLTLFAFVGVGLVGAPIFYWTTAAGIPLDHVEGMGMPIPEKLIPHYSFDVIFYAMLAIGLITLVVAWLPSRNITKLEPAQALTGRH